MERPCQCGECHLCAVYAAAHGLPVKMPVKQPTLAELAAFNSEAETGKIKKQKRRKPSNDGPDLFRQQQE